MFPVCHSLDVGIGDQGVVRGSPKHLSSLVGITAESTGGVGDGIALSSSRSSTLSQGSKARSVDSSPRSEDIILCHFSSEKVDVVSIDQDETGDLSPQSIQYKELLEVVTHVVAKLNID